ncbi:sporulation-specific diadenylate cyclase CdaS [Paenibacillus sp. HJGM_3]|uniref:sporulation-specific diadenylate cyclase CdaS n=1 Tax=Paenibacillus sp. HJGM_3 TaxID=3379816 RepID=UPI00385C1F20
MAQPNGDCDFSPMLISLKQDLKQVSLKLDHIVNEFDQEHRCFLGEFQRIAMMITDVQTRAATYYLSCYLSPYTSKYADLATSVRNLADRHHGALLVVERNDPLDAHLQGGTSIKAEINPALLESIFYPGNPLHDGAVLIRTDRIISAKNILPLSRNLELPAKRGTRHRAAVGLSELSDAIVLVVSEETGDASFAIKGELYPLYIH